MSEYDLIRIRRVGDRLRAAFRALVEGFPPGARNISGMARWLNVHKATCQRIVEGLDPARDGLSAFARLPGVEGMRLHIIAAGERGVARDLLDATSAAIDEYETLLTVYGRTQRGLVRVVESMRTEAAGPGGQPDRELAEDQRKALFDGARRVTGEEMRGKAIIAIVRPRPDQASRLEAFLYSRLIGVRRHSYSRPIVMGALSGWWSHIHPSEPAASAGSRPAGVSAEFPPFDLIREFSTAGVRPVKVGSADARTLIVVDLDQIGGDGDGHGPADVTGRFYSGAVPSPLWDSRSRLNFALRVVSPARAMLMDVYIHHTLAAELSPQLACYSLAAPPGDSPDGGPSQCWNERLPESAEVQTLAAGVEPPEAIAHFPRHDEVVRYAFAREQVDRSEYVGFRCESAYPIWQSEYRMYFESPVPQETETPWHGAVQVRPQGHEQPAK